MHMANVPKRMTVSEARKELSEVTNRVAYGTERVVLTRHGRPAVAVISAKDLAILEAIEDRMDLAEARAALASPKNRRERVAWNDLKGELGL